MCCEALEQVVDDRGGKPGRGLVEQDDLRIRDQCAREREHLALPARERSGTGAAPLVQEGKRLDDAFDLLGRICTDHPRAELEVLEHRHVREDVRQLRDIVQADTREPVRLPPRDLVLVVPERKMTLPERGLRRP